jgi:hypothetical protein
MMGKKAGEIKISFAYENSLLYLAKEESSFALACFWINLFLLAH